MFWVWGLFLLFFIFCAQRGRSAFEQERKKGKKGEEIKERKKRKKRKEIKGRERKRE